MSWNPVLNKFVEIKNLFIKVWGEDLLYEYDRNTETCIEYWARMLDNPRYNTLLEPLQLDESEDGMLLLRYANYWASDDEYDTERDFFKRYDGFYQECRSVVIDIFRNELIIAPFKKFRNLNECEEYSEAAIRERIKNAKSIELSNKLDGSMQCGRYYNNRYVLTGARAADTSHSWRLQSGYRLLKDNYKQMLRDNSDYTFIFEHITKEDAHVVNYTDEQEGLYLIGIRSISNGTELDYKTVIQIAKLYNKKTTELFKKSLDEVLSELDTKKSNEAEGFVLSIDGFKVKIKYNDYLMVHHMIDRFASVNTIIKAIADGTYDDAISRVPENFKEQVETVANAIRNVLAQQHREIKHYVSIGPKELKAFMQWVDVTVPKKLRGYVRCEFLGNDYNMLKTPHGRYKNLAELGIDKEELFKPGQEQEYE